MSAYEATRLWNVELQLTMTVVIQAANSDSAERYAEQNCYEIVRQEDSRSAWATTMGEVKSPSDLINGWDAGSVPYGGSPDAIAEILALLPPEQYHDTLTADIFAELEPESVQWTDPRALLGAQPSEPGLYLRDCGASPMTDIPDYFDGTTWYSVSAAGERNNRPAFVQDKPWRQVSAGGQP
jgi:hypothetical protein